jgi:hypothetical protein
MLWRRLTIAFITNPVNRDKLHRAAFLRKLFSVLKTGSGRYQVWGQAAWVGPAK